MNVYKYYCALIYFKNSSKGFMKHLVQTEDVDVNNELHLFIEMGHHIENLLDIPIKIKIVELIYNPGKTITFEIPKYVYKSNNFEDKED